MRPVDRGEAPRQYKRYDDAIDDLADRLGRYCSYCERCLPASLAVEHMAPKSLQPERSLDWGNFLLGCTNCNSLKSDRPTDDDSLVWPDRDNTLLAFTYFRGGFVRASAVSTEEVKSRAENLIDLVGLSRHPAHGWPAPTGKDKRWQQREAIWAIAEKCKVDYIELDRNAKARDLVIEVAKGYGFFSVWFAIFEEHEEVRKGLVESFPGTPSQCFDSASQAIARPGGVI